MDTCTIEINDKEYTFCLTREAIKWLEARGLNLSDLASKTVTYIDLFWVAGLIAKHGDLSEAEALQLRRDYENVNAPVEEQGDVMEVISFLVEEYTNFVYALTDTGLNKKKKKAKIVKG